jgi:hypothetical protein
MPTNVDYYIENFSKEKIIVMLIEADVIYSPDFEKQLHSKVGNILTWHDSFIDNKKYFKYIFTNNIAQEKAIPFNEKKLCSMVSSYLLDVYTSPEILYPERIKAIDFFEKMHPKI